jgi:hypothetical protein
MAITGLCITLYNCETGETIHYETYNTGLAQSVIDSIGIGNVGEINDPANFPNTYYTIVSACDLFKPECAECVGDPDKIFDISGASLEYWYPTDYGNDCPQDNPTITAYVLVNCASDIEFTNPEDIDQSPLTALVTSADLSLYLGMVVKLEQYPNYCYNVLGPYVEDTGCPCDEYTVIEGFSDCVCCNKTLPPAPDPTCCEIPKYTQKPVHKYYMVTEQDCDIKANTKFANNYYRYYTTLRYGIQNCCEGVDMDMLLIKKEMADYRKMQFGTCSGTTPELCLYVVGSGACGSQTAEYNEFINGKWSWKFTRDTGVVGILYWDNVNNYWICANYDTEVIAARLKLYSDYPLATNEEWETVNVLSCLSPESGLSTWLIPCELCPSPTPVPCEEPEDVSATGSFT